MTDEKPIVRGRTRVVLLPSLPDVEAPRLSDLAAPPPDEELAEATDLTPYIEDVRFTYSPRPTQLETLRQVFGPASAARIDATMRDFASTMAKVTAVLNRVTLSPAWRRLLGLPLRDEHHPERLPIDGAAYRRRRNARKRRR